MSIFNTDKVDWCYTENTSSRLLLLMIFDDTSWDDVETHLLKLQEKLNTYFLYIETEQYKSFFPNNIFAKFKIQIMFKYKPTSLCIDFLTNCSLFCEDYNRKHKISIKIIEDLSCIGKDLDNCERF